jgi:hypothetical protein
MIGSVDWNDQKQRQRTGIDLRGADVRGALLGALPLTKLLGALEPLEAYTVARSQRFLAVVQLEWADLSDAHLEFAQFGRPWLQRADLGRAYLYGAYPFVAHLEGPNLSEAKLAGAILRTACLNVSTPLDGAVLSDVEHGAFQVIDVGWAGCDMTTLSWYQVSVVGEERLVRQLRSASGERKSRGMRLLQFECAVRANRQVAVHFRQQGFNENADKFAYRAQVLQLHTLMRQRQLIRALGAWMLYVSAGYGYKPVRSVVTYLVVIAGLAAGYLALSNAAFSPFVPSQSSPLTWYEASVLSVSNIHGRGLFPTGLTLGDPLTILAAFEAVVGILIEIVLIATFSQRYLAR